MIEREEIAVEGFEFLFCDEIKMKIKEKAKFSRATMEKFCFLETPRGKNHI